MKCCFDLSCCIQVIVSRGLPSLFNHIEVASEQDPGGRNFSFIEDYYEDPEVTEVFVSLTISVLQKGLRLSKIRLYAYSLTLLKVV